MKIPVDLMLAFGILIAGGFWGSPISADESLQIRRPFLWSIEAVDDAKPIATAWLYGTIHVPDKALTKMHPLADAAWKKATAAYFEIDFLEDSADQTAAISLLPGTRLEDLIPASLVKRLDERLAKISPATTRQVLPNACVSIWPLLLGNLEAQVKYPGRLPMDMKMYAEAKRGGRRVGGLEKAGQQLTALRELPMADQIAFLQGSLDALDEGDTRAVSPLQRIKQLYVAGDASALSAFIDQEFRRADVRAELLDVILKTVMYDRNKQMADRITQLIRQEPDEVFFFSVGIGHLVGGASVQDMLSDVGFRAVRVSDELSAVEPKVTAD